MATLSSVDRAFSDVLTIPFRAATTSNPFMIPRILGLSILVTDH
jgi:hypothetical protein